MISRRSAVASLALAGLGGRAAGGRTRQAERRGLGVHAAFPAQDPDLVREIVGASHGNLARVKELLDAMPQLANAAYDWGFGDWETPLGAASHTGRREVALLLVERGARLDIFAHAMLGHEAAVRGAIGSMASLARLRGPHGLSLAHHARAGGEAARGVVEYLAGLGDADLALEHHALTPEEAASVVGTYAYGPGADERLEVFARDDGSLMVRRVGGVGRGLRHLGERVFTPAGAPDVRIALTPLEGAARRLVVSAPMAICVADRA